MVRVKFKSAEELKHSLRGAKRVAVFSCGGCANLSDVAGEKGLKIVTRFLEEWGREVAVAKTMASCCPESVMRHAQQVYLKPSQADALVVISCAAGVKSAFLCEPGVPIVAACDTVGIGCVPSESVPMDNLVASGLCTTCGHCVISYTGGICPLAHCPAKSLYGPCKRAPVGHGQCASDPQRDCVWREIEDRGTDLATLQALRATRAESEGDRLPSADRKASPALVRRVFSYIAARLPGQCMEPIHWVR